jgi:hypothetical protein
LYINSRELTTSFQDYWKFNKDKVSVRRPVS